VENEKQIRSPARAITRFIDSLSLMVSGTVEPRYCAH
jgi:hypothetical protein